MLKNLLSFLFIYFLFTWQNFAADLPLEKLQKLILVVTKKGERVPLELKVLENLDNRLGFDTTLALSKAGLRVGEISLNFSKREKEIFIRSMINKTINSKGERELFGIGTSLLNISKMIAITYKAKSIRLIADSELFNSPKYDNLIEFYTKKGFKPGTKEKEMILLLPK